MHDEWNRKGKEQSIDGGKKLRKHILRVVYSKISCAYCSLDDVEKHNKRKKIHSAIFYAISPVVLHFIFFIVTAYFFIGGTDARC